MNGERDIMALRDWLAAVDPAIRLVHSLGEPMPEHSVCMQLLHARPEASRQVRLASNGRPQRPPQEVLLRYAVVVSAPNPLEAERLLVELVHSGTKHDQISVLDEPVPPAFWMAWGLRPKPAIQIDYRRVHVDSATPDSPRVRQMHVDVGLLEMVRGRVVGLDDVPVAGATVELLSLGRSLKTDAGGWFRFAGLACDSEVRLRVRAKGMEVLHSASADEILKSEGPLLIRIAGLET